MSYYSKLIAAVVGMAALIASRYGFDLESNTQLITDALVSVVTAYGVWKLKNVPQTDAQVKEQRAAISEAVKDIG